MPEVTLPIYDNEVKELTVFHSQEAAQDWLKENELDTSGTTILIPFKDSNDKVHFLRPSNPNISDPNGKTANDEDNANIRIIGAANDIHVHSFWKILQAAFTTNRVPHLDELEGDIINLTDHGFIIIYKKGNKKTSDAIFEFLEQEKERLIEKISKAQTNEVFINQAEFLEAFSKLAMQLDIKGGMCYFFRTDKEGNQSVYRQTFKQDANEKKLEQYLTAEKKWHESQHVKIEEHKSQNHHILSFLKDWLKWTVFAAITAIGAGLILGIFIAPPIGPIAAGLVAVVTFIATSGYGFHRANKNNSTTIEFGASEFVPESPESQTTFFSRIRKRFNNLFFSRTNETDASPTEDNSNKISTAAPTEITTSVNDSVLTDKLSLRSKAGSLFKFSKEEKLSIIGNNFVPDSCNLLVN